MSYPRRAVKTKRERLEEARRDKFSLRAITWRQWLGIGLAAFSVAGFVPWILEEATQSVQFAVHTAIKAGQYSVAARGIEQLEVLRGAGLVLSVVPGILNPFTCVAYISYFNGACGLQITSLRQQVAEALGAPEDVAVIGVEEAAEHVGEWVSVHGLVQGVVYYSRVAKADLGGLSLVCFPGSPWWDRLRELDGKRVEVVGKVKSYKGQLEVILDGGTQVVVVGEEPLAKGGVKNPEADTD